MSEGAQLLTHARPAGAGSELCAGIFFWGIAFCGLNACAPYMRTIPESRSALQAEHPDLVRHAPWAGGELRYVALGDASSPPVVFVHGSPGSWDVYAPFLHDPRLSSYLRIAYDRPGFGGTQPGQEEPSLQRQAEALEGLLDDLGVHQPVRLVGHSLGGAVIARFAMDHPERTAGLVFVASSVDPALEKRLWYQKIADRRIFQPLIADDLLTSNRELRPFGPELAQMLPLWPRIQVPVAIVHARDDGLVPFVNVAFLEEHLSGVRLRETLLPKGGHLILWSQEDLVVDAIRWLDQG